MFHRWWRAGNEVFVVACDDSYRQSMMECEDAYNAPFTIVEPWNPDNDNPIVPSIDYLNDVMTWFNPDIVYVGGEPHQDGAYEVARDIYNRGICQVWAVSQNIGMAKTNENESKAMLLINGYICCSESVKMRYNEIEAHHSNPLTPKLRSGVGAINDEVFRYYPPRERIALRKKNMPDDVDNFIIGFAGRMIPEKGIENVILAISKMTPVTRDRVRFLIAGDRRPHTATLENIVSEHGLEKNVSFVGYQPNRKLLAEWMACLDLFVLPSLITSGWIEQLGLVLIEAGMVGTPSVASECGGPLDIIINQQTGMFARPGDHLDLKDKIEWMITHPRQRHQMGTEASKYMIDRYGLKESDRELKFLKDVKEGKTNVN